jgi:hypothetical protein
MKNHALVTYWWDIMHNLILGLQFCCNYNLIYVYYQAFNEDGINFLKPRDRERESCLFVVISLIT